VDVDPLAAVGAYKGPGHEYDPGPPALSIPPAGLTVVSTATNAVTGRIDVFRDGFRIAVAKTSFHAGEVAAHAALAYPNPWKRPTITSFEAPAGT
jgi:hypothetical protein